MKLKVTLSIEEWNPYYSFVEIEKIPAVFEVSPSGDHKITMLDHIDHPIGENILACIEAGQYAGSFHLPEENDIRFRIYFSE